MAYRPVSGLPTQFSTNANELASGYYLKFYAADTSTPLSMATDGTGAQTLAYCKLNTTGYPITDPNDNLTVFIPHLNQVYRSVLYPTETDAQNDTNGINNIPNTNLFIEEAYNKQSYTATFSSNTYTVTPEINPEVFAPWQAGLILNIRLPTSTSSVTGDLSLSYNGTTYPICWSNSSETRVTTDELETPDNTYVTLRVNAAATKAIIISDVSGSNSNGDWERKSNGWQNCFDVIRASSGGFISATLAKSFTNTTYSVATASSDSASANIINAKINTKTASGFQYAVVGISQTPAGLGYLESDMDYTATGLWR